MVQWQVTLPRSAAEVCPLPDATAPLVLLLIAPLQNGMPLLLMPWTHAVQQTLKHSMHASLTRQYTAFHALAMQTNY